LSGLTSTPTL